jgi:hypothetical protein
MKRTMEAARWSVLLIFWGATLQGQAGPPPGRIYDPSTVVTTSGVVVSMDTATGPGMQGGVHLTLRTADETLSVHLGPAWFVSTQKTRIVSGDTVQVTGSRVTVQGTAAMVAAEVKKGNEVLILRGQDGVPLWAGRGRPW